MIFTQSKTNHICTTIVILSALVILLSWSFIRKWPSIDDHKIWENRSAMLKCARQEYEKGMITREILEIFVFVSHPDFRKMFDYVPPERQEYTMRMQKMDLAFWKRYRITPDYVLPVNFIYELYKSHISDWLKQNRPIS